MNKFLADENIPIEVVLALKQLNIDIVSVKDIQIGMSDEEVLLTAIKSERTIITFDSDFGELIYKLKRNCSGIILLKIHPQTIQYILSILKKTLAPIIDFKNSFCVVESHRIRVLPLNPDKQ